MCMRQVFHSSDNGSVWSGIKINGLMHCQSIGCLPIEVDVGDSDSDDDVLLPLPLPTNMSTTGNPLQLT